MQHRIATMLGRLGRLGAWALVLAVTGSAALGQGITLPPSGNNQRASVSQHIGLVEVRIDYSSPDVTGPNGEDRRGKIWGGLVPYGLTNLGFGNGNPGPWRAGANENTVLTVSHDVEIEGQPLAAGRYGLHVIAGEKQWTLVLSNNSTSWGSFFYDPSEDALRVTLEPEPAPFREWLTYDFIDRQAEEATVALHWEELRVPFRISVPNATELYLAEIRHELRDSPGFNWQNWMAAAQFCVQQNTNLDEGLQWAEAAISAPFVGQENFSTLQTKSQVLSALGRSDEAQQVMATAIRHRSATPIQIHGYARALQAQGDVEGAIEVFRLNEKLNGDSWPVHVGMARAYSAEGKYAKALQHAKLAYAEAPDALNKNNLEQVITILESGKDFNSTN